MLIDIEKAIALLSEKRKLFASEADFQLELAWQLRELYPDAKVRMEYCPSFDPSMHIDILVIKDGKWIPIELKYKTERLVKDIDGERFELKKQGAKDVGCYLYLHDIQRVEQIKKKVESFAEGYTVMITNDLSYTKTPLYKDCAYAEFSLHHGTTKSGTLNWGENTGAGTKKGIEDPIVLQSTYPMHWKQFSNVDGVKSGLFVVLINTVQ